MCLDLFIIVYTTNIVITIGNVTFQHIIFMSSILLCHVLIEAGIFTPFVVVVVVSSIFSFLCISYEFELLGI